MSPEEIKARVVASRAAQGLPPVVEDVSALERLAALLRPAADSAA